MKKIAFLLVGCMLLVGCARETHVTEVTVLDSDTKEQTDDIQLSSNMYYRQEIELMKQLETIGELSVKEYPEEHSFIGGIDSIDIMIPWESVQKKGVPLSQSETIAELEKLVPGTLAFVEKMENDTTSTMLQSTVINNVVIRMKPKGLVDNSKGFDNSYEYFSLTANGVVLNDGYLKKLASVVPGDQFIVNIPRTSGETKMLSMSTPAFETGRNLNSCFGEEICYEKNGISYQLYIKNNELIKMRVIFKKFNTEQIDRKVFEPLYTWAETELKLSNMEIEQLETLVLGISESPTGSEKGKIGDYTYIYRAVDNPDLKNSNNRYGNKVNESIVELVISK